MDVPTGKRLIRLRERIVHDFKKGDWEAVGLLTGQTEIIEGHDRLLRSLFFGDDDYPGNALTVLRRILEADPKALDVIEEYADEHYPSAPNVPPMSDTPEPKPEPNATPPVEYDVALSFAGEDREYVERVANLLRDAGLKVFYDKFETARLWGSNLADHLGKIYGQRARFVVLFVSKHYPAKPWPTHERQSAQARAIREGRVILLPARFDDTDIPGLPSTTSYVDLRSVTPEDLVELIREKLRDDGDA